MDGASDHVGSRQVPTSPRSLFESEAAGDRRFGGNTTAESQLCEAIQAHQPPGVGRCDYFIAFRHLVPSHV